MLASKMVAKSFAVQEMMVGVVVEGSDAVFAGAGLHNFVNRLHSTSSFGDPEFSLSEPRVSMSGRQVDDAFLVLKKIRLFCLQHPLGRSGHP